MSRSIKSPFNDAKLEALAKGGKRMNRFIVSISEEIEADTAEEAALLMYDSLTNGAAPLAYSVVNSTEITKVTLDRVKADEFAAIDHTADPGNW